MGSKNNLFGLNFSAEVIDDWVADRYNLLMSFQAYLDNIEVKTGKAPIVLINEAREKGFDKPGTKAGDIIRWLKEEYDLGRGHAMALVSVIKNGPKIDGKHVDSGGRHSDEYDTLILTGNKGKK